LFVGDLLLVEFGLELGVENLLEDILENPPAAVIDL